MSTPIPELAPEPFPAKPKRRPSLRMQVQAPEISEKQREKNATGTLRSLGYTVKHLGKPIPVTCKNPKCRTFQWAKTTGNSTGVADLLVTHAVYWPAKCWIMIETKKSDKADRSEEQIKLAEAGLSTFYVTEEEAVRTIIAAEQRMGLEPNPKLLNWLRGNVKGAWFAENQALLANDLPNAAWRP